MDLSRKHVTLFDSTITVHLYHLKFLIPLTDVDTFNIRHLPHQVVVADRHFCPIYLDLHLKKERKK